MTPTAAERRRKEQQRIEWVRWAILRGAEATAEYGASLQMLLRVANSEEVYLPHYSEKEIRAEVHYLSERQMVRTDAHPLSPRIFLTRTGRDFIDYAIPAQPGVYRPPLPS